MELCLDGNDWQLTHLIPCEWRQKQVWREEWKPSVWPAAPDWIQGTVPGDVVADALDAGLIPDPYVDMQSRQAEWLALRDWVYRKEFVAPPGYRGKAVRLCFGGVDYACHVHLNGELLGSNEGMFRPFSYDVTRRLRYDRPNVLLVVVEHAPRVDDVQGQIGWTSRARTWKPRFAYNWDWCTRLVTLGIWQSVKLVATEGAWIDDVCVRPVIDGGAASFDVRVRLAAQDDEAASQGWKVQVVVEDPDGNRFADATEFAARPLGETGTDFSLAVPQPQLWWPNGMGKQPLYRVRVSLLTFDGLLSDERCMRAGLRTIRLTANEGAPAGALGYTFEVNGRRMFVKGWNWVPIDHMYGRVQAARYRHLVSMAAHAHCNLLRVWGGGLLERQEFYDACDEAGILVWQEFMHSSSGLDNFPPEDNAYLDYIEDHARRMIPQRRNHASLALWCGGNELMNARGVPLDDTHPALARLKAVVQELDPGRAWLPTSASGPLEHPDISLAGKGAMHDIHGPWQYNGPEDYYTTYNAIDCLYHSEFGAEGIANHAVLKRYVSLLHRFPANATDPVWVHHGSWWINRQRQEELFGLIGSLDVLVKTSQWMQAEGLRYAIESNRRRKWTCSGVSPWQLNEAFPNTACTNVIDYLGNTKPAYWWVRKAYEPVHLSVKYDRLTWHTGETWTAELWLNNSGGEFPGGRWTAELAGLDGKVLTRYSGALDVPEDAAMQLSTLSHQMPVEDGVWILYLRLIDAKGNLAAANDYVFTTHNRPVMIPLLETQPVELAVKRRGTALTVANPAATPALFVQIDADDCSSVRVSDGYFCLAPGESRVLTTEGKGRLSIGAWNAKPVKVSVR